MSFSDEYSVSITESEYKALGNDPEVRSTILPFFGFTLRTDTQSRVDTYGGNIYATQTGADSFRLDRSPTGVYNRFSYSKVFRREQSALTDRDLETKVQAWLKANGFDDIWNTPYICPTAEAFHRLYGDGPSSALYTFLAAFFGIVGLLLTLVLALNHAWLASLLPESMSFLTMQITLSPLTDGLFLAVLLLFFRHQHNKKHRARPLAERNAAYQKALRARYYKGMAKLFGKELGEAMKQFSIRREEAGKK